MIAERDVVKSCLRLLALKGIMAWRANNAGIRVGEGGSRYAFHGKLGVPDILGILPRAAVPWASGGRFLGIECKSAEGRQSESQAAFQAECERAGGVYLLVRSAAELAEKLAELGP
jgi:hypothetical protein